jgi:hypothetical protein
MAGNQPGGISCEGGTGHVTQTDDDQSFECYVLGDVAHHITTPSRKARVLASPAIAEKNEEKKEFYLPVNRETKLLKCGDKKELELRGTVMESEIEGDSQQWFKSFSLHFDGKKVAGVSVAANAKKVNLTSIEVTVGDRTLTHPENFLVGNNMIALNVTQDSTKLVGRGYVETVAISTKVLDMKITSRPGARKMHLDMDFNRIDASSCNGVLPEIWGIRPMSLQTTKYLKPHKDQ